MEFVKNVGPIGMIFIMFSLGLNLTAKDFLEVVKKPRNLTTQEDKDNYKYCHPINRECTNFDDKYKKIDVKKCVIGDYKKKFEKQEEKKKKSIEDNIKRQKRRQEYFEKKHNKNIAQKNKRETIIKKADKKRRQEAEIIEKEVNKKVTFSDTTEEVKICERDDQCPPSNVCLNGLCKPSIPSQTITEEQESRKKAFVFDFDQTIIFGHSHGKPDKIKNYMTENNDWKIWTEVFDKIKNKKYLLFVNTRGLKKEIQEYLQFKLGKDYFDEVFGADSKKDIDKGSSHWATKKKEVLEKIMKDHTLEKKDIYFFDDTEENINTAKEGGFDNSIHVEDDDLHKFLNSKLPDNIDQITQDSYNKF